MHNMNLGGVFERDRSLFYYIDCNNNKEYEHKGKDKI